MLSNLSPIKTTNMHTGHLIRLLRLVRGMNQKGMAAKMGISQQAFSKLEKQASIQSCTLHKMLQALSITADDFQKAMATGSIDFIR